MTTMNIQIPDMQSPHCQLRVTRALAALDGVTVNKIRPGEADVTIDQDAFRTDVYDAIRESGYTIAGVALEQEAGEGEAVRTFKTNIHCSGCAAQVAPGLDAIVGAGQWRVDIGSPDKVLTVSARNIDEADILRAVREAGYAISPIDKTAQAS